VQLDCGLYHYRLTAVSAHLKKKVGLTLPKSAVLRIFIFRCSSSKSNPVYVSRVDSSALVFSLSSYRHSYIGLVFSSRFID
jgi:hypothetical protein